MKNIVTFYIATTITNIPFAKHTSHFQMNGESAHIIAECHTPTSSGTFYDVIHSGFTAWWWPGSESLYTPLWSLANKKKFLRTTSLPCRLQGSACYTSVVTGVGFACGSSGNERDSGKSIKVSVSQSTLLLEVQAWIAVREIKNGSTVSFISSERQSWLQRKVKRLWIILSAYFSVMLPVQLQKENDLLPL